MLRKYSLLLSLVLIVTVLLFGAGSALAGPCTGPGAPTTTQTKCLTAVDISGGGNPLRSFDISWVNPDRAEYYLADRSNAAIAIVDTHHLTFKRRLGGFVGIVLTNAGKPNEAVDNNHSGPDGVVTHNRWLYAGDGNSDVRVYDLNAPTASAFKQKISTGGTTRVDEMALTTDGTLLLAANNAEDPPFGTLFRANGDSHTSAVSIITKITVDPTIIPPGAGLSIEQPTWEPRTQRFYVSVPQIANNPPGCTFGGPVFCEGGLLVIDPTTLAAPTAVISAFDAATNTGVVKLHECGPNGATVGPNADLLLGCTPQNVPTNTTTLVINATTKNFTNVGGITGSDEVWFNAGDNRYYLGASRDCGAPAGCPNGGAVLGVVGADSILIEKIPQGSASHSVAADSERNLIFVPQVAPKAVVGNGGDTTTVGAGICGGNDGCVAVYVHDVDQDKDDEERDHDGGDRDRH